MRSEWFDSDEAELDFLLQHPFIGGDGEGAGEENDSAKPNVEGSQPEGGTAKPGDTGRPPTEGQWIPKHRFDEVNSQFGMYKQFGRPEEVKKRLDRLTELEQLPANRLNDKEKSEIRKELLSVFPELALMADTLQNQKQAYTERGAAQNNDFLKDIGIEVNDANNQYLQELLSGIIAQDPKLLRRFYSMDDRVFTDAFAVAKKTFWPNVRRVVPGAGTESKKLPPKAPGQQKPPQAGEKKGDEPLDRLGERDVLDKASEAAFAMLEGSRED